MEDITINRRGFIKGLAGTAAGVAISGGLITSQVHAQTYPSKPIETLIPFGPGGGTDRSARVLTPAWSEVLGMARGLRIKYQPGAGTLIAQNSLKRAKPDGYTILLTPEPYAAWLSVIKDDKFSLEQISWVGSYFQDPDVLLVPKNSPYKTAQEFIDAARESDREFTASVSAPMSASHAATVVLRERAGINLKIIPFPSGGSAARNAVAGGHVDCCVAPYWSATNILDLVRGLVIFWPEDPSTGLWNAPPASHALDFKMPDLSEPYSVAVSSQMKEEHPDRYKKLHDSFEEAITTKTFNKAAKNQGMNYFVEYWDAAKCEQFTTDYLSLLNEYLPAMQRDIENM